MIFYRYWYISVSRQHFYRIWCKWKWLHMIWIEWEYFIIQRFLLYTKAGMNSWRNAERIIENGIKSKKLLKLPIWDFNSFFNLIKDVIIDKSAFMPDGCFIILSFMLSWLRSYVDDVIFYIHLLWTWVWRASITSGYSMPMGLFFIGDFYRLRPGSGPGKTSEF